MSTIDDAAEVIGRYVHPDFAEDAARDLAAEGHLAHTPQVIRTVEEQESIDQDTLLMSRKGYLADAEDNIRIPAVVVATAAQVRAARKALEEA